MFETSEREKLRSFNIEKKIYEKNDRGTIGKHKCNTECKKEMRSYSIEKFFKSMKKSENRQAKRNLDSSFEGEYPELMAKKSREHPSVWNLLDKLKKPRMPDNKITNYFKDVKFAPSASDSSQRSMKNKENVLKVKDSKYQKTETVEDVIESLKSMDQRNRKLKRPYLSLEKERTCARQCSKNSSLPVTLQEKKNVDQTMKTKKITFEEFTQKVLEKIRNKSSPRVKAEYTNRNVYDNMLSNSTGQNTVSVVEKNLHLLSTKYNSPEKNSTVEVPTVQNPISKFIESLGLQNINHSVENVDSPSSSREYLQNHCRIASPTFCDTKSCGNGKSNTFIEESSQRFHMPSLNPESSLKQIQNMNQSVDKNNIEHADVSICRNKASKEYNEEIAYYLKEFVESLTEQSSAQKEEGFCDNVTINTATNFCQSPHHKNFADEPSENILNHPENMQMSTENCASIEININEIETTKNSLCFIGKDDLVDNVWLNQVLSEIKSIGDDRIADLDEESTQKSIESEQFFKKETPGKLSWNIETASKTVGIENEDNICHEKSNLWEDKEIRNILTENYEKYRRMNDRMEAQCESQLDSFCKKLSRSSEREGKVNRKCNFKRFRKGKVKIYRLAKLAKIVPHPKESETLNIDELLIKMSQGFVGRNSNFARCKSTSSVSTTSSYITDETTSGTLSTGSQNLSSPQQKLRKGLNEICKDKSLFCDKQQRHFTVSDRDEIKMKIQNIFLQVFDDLTNGRRSFLKYRRQSFENCTLKDGLLQYKSNGVSMSVINSGMQRSYARFKLILYILKKIQTLLETNTKLTKRELFYQLKHLIGDQRVTDRAINSISCLLDVGMWALNIVAQKGLVFGNLKILLASGETINCNVPGTLIPQDISEIIEIQSAAYFVLVVEKESIFHRLIEEDLPNRLTRPFVMITGKGFPDLNTQLFLKKLWTVMAVPVFLLVDADPHGINIMLNYRFGSVSNAHVSHHLAVPSSRWLGVFPSEIDNGIVKRQPMSARETKMALDLLKTPYMSQHPRIADELNVLIDKNYKAGIEGLIKSDIYLSEVYLPTKFLTKDFV